jgi:hypothetical protein
MQSLKTGTGIVFAVAAAFVAINRVAVADPAGSS